MLTNRNNAPKGECEQCTNVGQLYAMHGNMLLCEECRDKELETMERSKNVNKILLDSRKIDSNVVLKTDVFVAKTIAATELRGAIEADDAILAKDKDYAYANECMTRFLTFQKAVFDKRQDLLETENEMRMWQVNTQNAAGKLSVEYRDKFKAVDVNYAPTGITKKIKTTKPVKAGKTFDKAAVFAAAKKYDVPASSVQSVVVSQNKLPEDAAKYLAELMGKLPVVGN